MSKDRDQAGMDALLDQPGEPAQADVQTIEPKPTPRRRRKAISDTASEPDAEPGALAARDLPITPQVVQAIEAILVSTDKPVTAARLGEALAILDGHSADPANTDASPDTRAQAKRVRLAIEKLNSEYEQTGRAFRVESLAGGYRLMTTPATGHVLKAFHGARERASLSRAALESLAIIAYKQPLTRARLEAIRGVACGEILRSLTERRLVTIVGRADELGRPLLYGTTRAFLEAFGLSSVKDLPTVEEFKARAAGTPDQDDDE